MSDKLPPPPPQIPPPPQNVVDWMVTNVWWKKGSWFRRKLGL